MSELHLVIKQGNIEIDLQGDGDIVYKIFEKLCSDGLGVLGSSTQVEKNDMTEQNDESNNQEEQTDENASSTKTKPKPKKKNTTNPPQLIKTLDLSGNEKGKSLKDFVNEKKPTTNIQRTAVFVYYLQHILGLSDITIDTVFTCYRTMEIPVPENLQANLDDNCSSKYGYLSRNGSKYTVSVVGGNFIEFKLPKKE